MRFRFIFEYKNGAHWTEFHELDFARLTDARKWACARVKENNSSFNFNGQRMKLLAVARTKHGGLLIPPVEDRLCIVHGIPIAASRWRSGHRHSDCSRCRNHHPSKLRNSLQRSYDLAMRHRRSMLGTHGNSWTVLEVFNRLTGFQFSERH